MKLLSRIVLMGLVFFSYSISNAQTYCYPTFTSCGFNNYLTNVNVGGMNNNTSGCAVWNYLNKTTSIVAGDTISMTVKVNGWDGIAVYIDLNNDGDLTDTLERLYSTYVASSPPITYNFTFTIPANTTAGNHRFRVMAGNGGSVSGSTNPCLSVPWGNFHDYTMKVTNNCPTDSNLAVSNVTSSSADFNWDANTGSGFEYILDTNSKVPTGSGTATTGTSYSASGLTTGQHYYFHIRTDCGNGIYSVWGMVDFVACNLPDAQINQSGDIKLCRGDTLFLSVPANTSNTYQWYMNNNKIPGQTSSTLAVSVFPSKYFVKVESLPECISTSDLARVTIHDKPAAPGLVAIGHDLYATSGFSTYEWYLNGNIISGSSDSVHTAVSNGLYHVKAIDSNGCFGISDSVEIITVGIEDIYNNNGLKIYPNPSSGEMLLELDKVGTYDIVITNTIGEVVYKEQIISSQKHRIQLNDSEAGVYLIRIVGEGKQMSAKLIVQ